MRVHAILFSALATAAMTGSADASPAMPSTIAAVDITRNLPAGSYAGVTYRYVEGVIHGEVSAAESVAGLSELAAGRATIPYAIAFHIVAPESPTETDAIVVEAPNRGNPIIARSLGGPGVAAAPQAGASPEAAAIGDSFLPNHRISLAAVQWQAGLAGGPPESAQGIGEVAVRDFGRWLGGAFRSGPAPVPIFGRRILAGVSQSAWFVNTFIAEGFNRDPETGRGVYQGAFTRNGNGVVLAINGFAESGRQFPYARNDLAPLAPDQLLSRPVSDPKLVDAISLNDFYRLRASVFARAPDRIGLRRYATAAPHARPVSAETVFETMKCNGGAPIALSTVSDALYLRPLVLGLFRSIGESGAAEHDLPPDAPFKLRPAPDDFEGLNRLGATPLWIPETGPNGAPMGGIPTLEATLPLGLAEPPALPPVVIASIADTCGNFSGWRPFAADELRRRYGSRANYLELARQKAADLVEAGYLLDEDEATAVGQVEAQLPADFQ
jgi:Alpha/beta hydrolase domain